jgi:hypothetical protein
VKPRPNVLRLMDEARAEGLKVAVASAGTKEAVTLVVQQLLGADRYEVCDFMHYPLDAPTTAAPLAVMAWQSRCSV